ncbi:hypothetical protein PtA15_9A551 [Puccinia triticina]|uniref:Uncharacterized protein n=1 Tax=Puccinia triticina TaxID=208348 RepID=A0ABY7CT19_9BASI|nr:uncharacterized protein PtA15_9A551 [Puccinia triticina]WAQ88424.1 hypothetical protein PtA15_9A551 [Puccinia triticina]
MVVESADGEPLLITAAERILPFPDDVPAALALEDGVQVDDGEDAEEVVVGDAAGGHVCARVGIDELVAQGAQGEVGALGDIEATGSAG